VDPEDEDFAQDLGEDFDADQDPQDDGNDADVNDAGSAGADGGDRVDPSDLSRDGARGNEGESRQVAPSRAQARIEALDRQVREAQARAEAAERRINDFTASQTRTTNEAQEQQRLAAMMPEERAEYFARKTAHDTTQQLAQLRSEMADSTDRAAFIAQCSANPALNRMKDRVEQMLTEHKRTTGQTLPREVVAKFLIGEQVLAKGTKAGAQQRKTAATRVAGQAARPVTGNSSAPAGRAAANDRAARNARLNDALI
jgi:hypothetical protein